MNITDFRLQVEEAERVRRRISATQIIQDDGSPLVSLKDSGFNLIYEPSMMEGYDYRVRQEVFGKIGRISQRLEQQNKLLIIRSVWRSFAHQRLLWQKRYSVMRQNSPDKSDKEIKEIVSHFIAPATKSMHATGGSVDALIHDGTTGRVLDFGNNDGLNLKLDETSYPYHPGISPEARHNRQLLIQLFEAEDFVVDILEYWHFDYGNANWAADKGQAQARYGVIESLPE